MIGTAKKGGSRKHGKKLDKCRLYALRGTRFRHKCARVLQSSGAEAEKLYRRGPRHARRYRVRHAK